MMFLLVSQHPYPASGMSLVPPFMSMSIPASSSAQRLLERPAPQQHLLHVRSSPRCRGHKSPNPLSTQSQPQPRYCRLAGSRLCRSARFLIRRPLCSSLQTTPPAASVRVDLIGGAFVPAIAAGEPVVVDSPAGDGAVPAGHAVEAAIEGDEARGAAVPRLEVHAHFALRLRVRL